MQIQGSSFYLLNTRIGWRTSETTASQGVAIGQSGGGLRLAASPDGPLALNWPDGSLGQLTLPRGFAFDHRGFLYVLGSTEPLVRRCQPVFPCREPRPECYQPSGVVFEQLPEVGGAGSGPRQFMAPAGIAIAGWDLYVADQGNRRVQVFSLARGLALHHVWTLDAAGRPCDPAAADAWDPADVTAFRGSAYILDARYLRVYRHDPGGDALELVVDGQGYRGLDCGAAAAAAPAAGETAGSGNQPPAGQWARLALDREGRIYVLDAAGPCLQIFSPDGRWLSKATDAGSVIGAFDPPGVTLHYSLENRNPARPWFHLPPVPGVPREITDDLYFDLDGQPVRPDFSLLLGPPSYGLAGTWESDGLDSGIYHCQWHRIVLDVAALPLGTQIKVATASVDPGAPDFDTPQWSSGFTFVGRLNLPDPAEDEPYDLLVPSSEGQCLRLRIELKGDGFATPEIRAIRVYYPRESYLRYLPAIYSADTDSRRFLERFLSIFQTTWDGIEETIDDSAGYFDPTAVPEALIDRLADWLALPLEQSWSGEQKRHLLQILPRQNALRGSAAGLRLYLQAYLQNIAGLTPEEQRGYPLLIEGYRERRYVQFFTPEAAAAEGPGRRSPEADRRGVELDRRARLWSREVVGRLQLDAYATIGQVRLVSTGDPRRDLFYEHAHRFRVFVPAAWIRNADDEWMLRRALEAEKPAHTAYDLRLVEPRMRVGIQSTVGVDTILGDYPATRLAAAGQDTSSAPSLPPRGRLGYDTVLSSAAVAPLRLAPAPGIAVGSVIR